MEVFDLPQNIIDDVNKGQLHDKIFEVFDHIDQSKYRNQTLIDHADLFRYLKAYVLYVIATEKDDFLDDAEQECNNITRTYHKFLYSETKVERELSNFITIFEHAIRTRSSLQANLIVKKGILISIKLMHDTPEYKNLEGFNEIIKYNVSKEIEIKNYDIDVETLFEITKCMIAFQREYDEASCVGTHAFLRPIIIASYNLYSDAKPTLNEEIVKRDKNKELVRTLGRVIRVNKI